MVGGYLGRSTTSRPQLSTQSCRSVPCSGFTKANIRFRRTEPFRVCRRLPLLRRMEHHAQANEQVFTRSARTPCAAERGDWFNNRRLLLPIGNIPPAEAEANSYAVLET